MIKFLIILIISFFLSAITYNCHGKENLKKIEMINDHDEKYISLNQEKLTIYNRSYYFTEADKVDSIQIYLSDIDWKIINKSFLDNDIIYFKNENNDIGEKTNSIVLGEKYLLTTSQRKVLVNYNYFFDNHKINQEKTKKFQKFMKVVDSIISSKKENK